MNMSVAVDPTARATSIRPSVFSALMMLTESRRPLSMLPSVAGRQSECGANGIGGRVRLLTVPSDSCGPGATRLGGLLVGGTKIAQQDSVGRDERPHVAP